MGNPISNQYSERSIEIPFSCITFPTKQPYTDKIHSVVLTILPSDFSSWHDLLNNVTATLAIGKCSRRNRIQVFRDGDCDVRFFWPKDSEIGGPEHPHTELNPYTLQLIKTYFTEIFYSIKKEDIHLYLFEKIKPTVVISLGNTRTC